MIRIFLFLILICSLGFANDTKWAVPDIGYSCKARLSQDWPGGLKGTVNVETIPFKVNMRAEATKLTAKDFTEWWEKSALKTLMGTSLEDVSFYVKLFSGDLSTGIEVAFSIAPKTLTHPLTWIVENRDNGVPKHLKANSRLYIGNREQVVKDGPIYFTVDCDLSFIK